MMRRQASLTLQQPLFKWGTRQPQVRLQADYSGGSKTRGGAARPHRSYQNPLAARDPSTRNIALPDRTGPTSKLDRISAEAQQKKVQKALALQLQQRVLWEGTIISDEAHHLVQHFAKLRTNPKYRDTRRLMVVSGREQLQELAGKGYEPHNLLLPVGEEVPEWVNRSKTEVVRAERHILDLCDPGTDGFIGDYTIPEPPPKEELIANVHRMKNVLVLDNVTDPGNLGALLRTAAGFAYDAVLTINHCADLYSHAVVRAARGAHFQVLTPFYTLREEDGDDAWAILSHVVERNRMQPLVFVPQHGEATAPSPEPSSVTQQDGEATASAAAAAAAAAPSPQAKRVAMSLHEYCMESYLGRGSRTTPAEQRTSHMIIASDDTARSLDRRLKRLPTAPITLTTDAPAADLMIALPTIMYQLRSSGSWDYLPADAEGSASGRAVQGSSAAVEPELGMLRDDRYLRPNLDEDEQRERAYNEQRHKKAKRFSKYKRSDISFYADAEKARIGDIAKNEAALLDDPLAGLASPSRAAQKKRYMPESIPNLKHEIALSMDRDSLRDEERAAQNRRRTSLYDNQLRRDGKKKVKGVTVV